MTRQKTPAALARDIRRHLRDHGSAEHAEGVQWFFKERVASHGWYTAALRRYGASLHKSLAGQPALVIDVAEALFDSRVLEEKVLAVFLVQRTLKAAGPDAFARFERWLDGVASWPDHDALTMFVLGPLLVVSPSHVRRVHAWARSDDPWHRRAAAVTLIHGVRRGLFAGHAARIARTLKRDPDDMVQKGLGWLLREWCKARPDAAVPIVLAIRPDTSRLVLRTACETLPPAERRAMLSS